LSRKEKHDEHTKYHLINVDFPLLNSTEKIYSLPTRHEKDTSKTILNYYIHYPTQWKHFIKGSTSHSLLWDWSSSTNL